MLADSGDRVPGSASFLRIWNLRRGDHEDNRASTYGRGFRSVVLSALLEFNFLKAAIGFLVLIIGPALLIGSVPILLVYYGRLKFHLLTSAAGGLLFSSICLILLVGFGLWIGRRLLRTGVDNFWHLHYTLVFPIFLIVRECLRTLLERFPRWSTTPEELDRKRRLGTILTALILAGSGIALAWSMRLSIGLPIADNGSFQPWPAMKAALVNAAIILGLSTAAESLYWLCRELAFHNAVLNWTPKSEQMESSVARVAHLSDLHLVGERYGCRMEAGVYGPRGNQRIRRAFRKLTTIHASTPLDRILLTGDITDAGTRAEWAEFIDLLRSFPDLRSRVSFVPGNHDVNIVDRTNPGRPDLPWSAGQSLRQFRVLVALDSLLGDRTHLVDRATGALGPSLREYLREGERVQRLRSLAQYGARHGRREMRKIWEAIFPLVEPTTGHGYGIILLDSNGRSHFSLTNAVGVVNRSQLRALKALLAKSPNHAWVILLHHQIVEYPVGSITLLDRIGLALVNAPDVLAALRPHAARIIVMHGHRHTDWVGTCGDIVLCSAPSVTLGSQESGLGSFHVNELAVGPDGKVELVTNIRACP